MTDSFTAELRDIIDRAFTVEHSGRATAQMVHNSVHRDLPEHLVDFLIGKGIRAQVSAYFREKDAEGLPKRPEANAAGEHADPALFTLEEFAFVYQGCLSRAESNAAQAEKWRMRCSARTGVDLALNGATA